LLAAAAFSGADRSIPGVTAAAGAVMALGSHRQKLRVPGGFLVGLVA
jgi:hypothetical protein